MESVSIFSLLNKGGSTTLKTDIKLKLKLRPTMLVAKIHIFKRENDPLQQRNNNKNEVKHIIIAISHLTYPAI